MPGPATQVGLTFHCTARLGSPCWSSMCLEPLQNHPHQNTDIQVCRFQWCHSTVAGEHSEMKRKWRKFSGVVWLRKDLFSFSVSSLLDGKNKLKTRIPHKVPTSIIFKSRIWKSNCSLLIQRYKALFVTAPTPAFLVIILTGIVELLAFICFIIYNFLVILFTC